MAKIKIDPEKCKGCNFCLTFCAFKVLEASGKVNKKGLSYVKAAHPENCKACGLCALMCPECCIEIEGDEE